MVSFRCSCFVILGSSTAHTLGAPLPVQPGQSVRLVLKNIKMVVAPRRRLLANGSSHRAAAGCAVAPVFARRLAALPRAASSRGPSRRAAARCRLSPRATLSRGSLRSAAARGDHRCYVRTVVDLRAGSPLAAPLRFVLVLHRCLCKVIAPSSLVVSGVGSLSGRGCFLVCCLWPGLRSDVRCVLVAGSTKMFARWAWRARTFRAVPAPRIMPKGRTDHRGPCAAPCSLERCGAAGGPG